MTALLEHLFSEELDTGTTVLAYAVGIAVGTAVAAFLLIAIS